MGRRKRQYDSRRKKVIAPLEYVGAAWVARRLGTTQQNVSKSGLAALKQGYRGSTIRPDALFEGRPLWLKSRFGTECTQTADAQETQNSYIDLA